MAIEEINVLALLFSVVVPVILYLILFISREIVKSETVGAADAIVVLLGIDASIVGKQFDVKPFIHSSPFQNHIVEIAFVLFTFGVLLLFVCILGEKN